MNVKNSEWSSNLDIEGRRMKNQVETKRIEQEIERKCNESEEEIVLSEPKPYMNSMTSRLQQSAKIVGLDMYEDDSGHHFPSNISSPALSTRSKLKFKTNHEVNNYEEEEEEDRSMNVRKVLIDVQTMSADSDFGDQSLLNHLDMRKTMARSRMVERRMKAKGSFQIYSIILNFLFIFYLIFLSRYQSSNDILISSNVVIWNVLYE